LVEPFDGKRSFAIDGQFPVGQQIFMMDFDPGNNQFLLVERQISRQQRTVENGIDGDFALLIRMDMRHRMLLDVAEEHLDQDSVKH